MTNLTFINLNCHISATFHTISKKSLGNFPKSFVTKILILSYFLIHFSYKDQIPDDLRSFLVNKFTCSSRSSSYIGKTCRHYKNRIQKHKKKDNKSDIFKHFQSTVRCFDSYNSLCSKIIDKAYSKLDLKIKEPLRIPNLRDRFIMLYFLNFIF